MEKPLIVTFRQIEIPASVEALIEQRAKRLERFYPRLVGCSVLVEGPGGHHQSGGPYRVQLDLRVPDADPIVVSRQKAEDLGVAIRESFDVAKRRLDDYAQIQRREVKRHELPATGRVVRVFPEEGYGFIETDEVPRREIYFHRNSLLDFGLEDLAPGAEVRFHEEQGFEGPQASSVTVTNPEPAGSSSEPGAPGTGAREKDLRTRASGTGTGSRSERATRQGMTVGDVMTRAPTTCSPRETAAIALRRMWEEDCGLLPVVDQSRLVGVVTDRDIAMSLLFRDARPSEAPIETVNQGPVFHCSPGEELSSALEAMADHQIRRLPVVENGRLVGLLSINEVALEARASHGELERPTYGDVAKALQAISVHRKLPVSV